MSMKNVVPYFRDVMKELGHREWTDAFNDENIPATVLDGSYHLRLGDATSVKQNMSLVEMEQGLTVTLCMKGYKNPALGRDKAVEKTEAVIAKALGNYRRTQLYPGVVNVKFGNASFTELSVDNDNVIKAQIRFTCELIFEPTT